MAYDATEVLRSLERPRLTVPPEVRPRWQRILGLHRLLGPKTYEGRILSAQEWLPYQERFRALGVTSSDEAMEDLTEEEAAELLSIFRDYLEEIGIPPEVVMGLPGRAMEEAVEAFFTCQSRAMKRGEG